MSSVYLSVEMENGDNKTSNTANNAVSLLKPNEISTHRINYFSILDKLILVSPTKEQYEYLQSHLEKLIKEGHGETFFDVGVGEGDSGLTNNEYDASVATLHSLAITQNADCILLQENLQNRVRTAQFLIRNKFELQDFLEIRIAVIGNVDAGKSTLLGVLIYDELDDGRGHARYKMFRHKHELESGRSSSVNYNILGFDSNGNVVNKPDHGSLDWVKTCEKSSKVITFLDLAGHERYLKTTMYGMTGHIPDFNMLLIEANAGVIGTTKEHLGLSLALRIPVFVVVTKIDMCPPEVLKATLKLLVGILKTPGCRKIPLMINNKADVVTCAINFVSERLCPIFQISNVNGKHLDLLKTFLNLLASRTKSADDQPAEFQIDDIYSVPGVGTVVTGTMFSGTIRSNDTLMLGPDPNGQFVTITVKSIHRNRIVVDKVKSAQSASFSIKKIKRSQIRKGMVIVSQLINPIATWEFDAQIQILHHPSTIRIRYQAIIHCGCIGQTAFIINMSEECLRTGDNAIVRFRFVSHPEYIPPGRKLLLRDGRTKAIGTVLSIPLPSEQLTTKPSKPKKLKICQPKQTFGDNKNQDGYKPKKKC